jgi:hypothetical protein
MGHGTVVMEVRRDCLHFCLCLRFSDHSPGNPLQRLSFLLPHRIFRERIDQPIIRLAHLPDLSLCLAFRAFTRLPPPSRTHTRRRAQTRGHHLLLQRIEFAPDKREVPDDLVLRRSRWREVEREHAGALEQEGRGGGESLGEGREGGRGGHPAEGGKGAGVVVEGRREGGLWQLSSDY